MEPFDSDCLSNREACIATRSLWSEYRQSWRKGELPCARPVLNRLSLLNDLPLLDQRREVEADNIHLQFDSIPFQRGGTEGRTTPSEAFLAYPKTVTAIVLRAFESSFMLHVVRRLSANGDLAQNHMICACPSILPELAQFRSFTRPRVVCGQPRKVAGTGTSRREIIELRAGRKKPHRKTQELLVAILKELGHL